MNQVTVVFDGDCGMCTRTMLMIKRRDHRDAIHFRPCQSIPEDTTGAIRRDECERAVIAIDTFGNVTHGSKAALVMLSALIQRQWPVRIGAIPGVETIMQGVYRLIARNRRRFPGVTPWCEQHPGQCEPTQDWKWYEIS